MKALCYFLFFIFSFPSLIALPTGNPAVAVFSSFNDCCVNRSFENPCGDLDLGCLISMPFTCTFDCGVGYWGNYVTDRKLKMDDRINETDGISAVVDIGKSLEYQDTVLLMQAGVFTLNLFSFIEVFGTLGTLKMHQTSFELQGYTTEDAPTANNFSIQTDNGLCVSGGANLCALRMGNFLFGGSGQYLYAKPKLMSISYDMLIENGPIHYKEYFTDYEHIYFEYREWQGAVGVSYLVAFPQSPLSVVAYACAKYSAVSLNFGHQYYLLDTVHPISEFYFFNQENARYYGASAGISIVGGARSKLTFETRFFDEEAFFGSFVISF